MSKMREFKIIDGTEEKVIESTSFKKALKSFQASSKAKMVTIEWETKKGRIFVKEQKLPIGRKKKLR
jgi:NADPH-dependent 7-cyano-7-deazaguanine reductase QueF-like protein